MGESSTALSNSGVRKRKMSVNINSDPANKKPKLEVRNQRHCDQCEYSGSSQALWNHKNYIHKGNRYPCDLCEYVATMPSSLKVHKESKHEGIRYPCDQCEYAATQISSLKRHKNLRHKTLRKKTSNLYMVKNKSRECYITPRQEEDHNDRRLKGIFKNKTLRYPCDQCDFAATQQLTLIRHMKTSHKVSSVSLPFNDKGSAVKKRGKKPDENAYNDGTHAVHVCGFCEVHVLQSELESHLEDHCLTLQEYERFRRNWIN